MKTRTKITLTYAMLTGLTIVLLCTVVYYLVKANKQQYFVNRLKDRASIVAQAFAGNEEYIRNLKEVYLDPLPDEQDYLLKVNAEAGTIEYDVRLSLPSQFYRDVLAKSSAWIADNYTFYYGQLFGDDDLHYIVIVSARDELGRARLLFLRNVLMFGSIGSIFAAIALGGFFAQRVIRPVSVITQEVNRISASNLHKRLPESTALDEIEQLKRTFNNMLDRLETSFEIQSNFINNASHELKTPIATVGVAIEALRNFNAMEDPRRTREYLDISANELQRLSLLVDKVLKLSMFEKKESNQYTSVFLQAGSQQTPFDL